jgi:hypothetical protein
MSSVAVAHFVVTGEFLTEHARQLWADEHEHERAVNILLNGLQGIDLGQVLQVLTGESKLVGDSSEGIELVPDGTSLSPCGQPLPSLSGAFAWGNKRAVEAEEDRHDLTEILANEGVMKPSPHGLVHISRRAARELEAERITWDDVRIYRGLMCVDAVPPREAQERLNRFLEDNGAAPLDPPPEPPRPPLSPHPRIVTDTGWLSRDGKFYPCGYQEHIRTAIMICEDLGMEEEGIGGAERTLEKKGWVKLAGHNGVFQGERMPTKAQDKAILDWCLGDGNEQTSLPYWLEPEY